MNAAKQLACAEINVSEFKFAKRHGAASATQRGKTSFAVLLERRTLSLNQEDFSKR